MLCFVPFTSKSPGRSSAWEVATHVGKAKTDPPSPMPYHYGWDFNHQNGWVVNLALLYQHDSTE